MSVVYWFLRQSRLASSFELSQSSSLHPATNTGAGDPHQATAEKGEQLMKVLVERVASFIVDLSAADLDDQFPF